MQRADTFSFVAFPILKLQLHEERNAENIDKNAEKWSKNSILKGELRLFYFISLGIHHLKIIEFDAENYRLKTDETDYLYSLYYHKET